MFILVGKYSRSVAFLNLSIYLSIYLSKPTSFFKFHNVGL